MSIKSCFFVDNQIWSWIYVFLFAWCYINKRYSGITSSSVTLTPNIYYRNTSTSLSSLSFTLGSVSNSNIINEYFIEFTTSSSGTTVSLPSGVKWMNGVAPTFEASTTYQISIVNNLGTWVKFK